MPRMSSQYVKMVTLFVVLFEHAHAQEPAPVTTSTNAAVTNATTQPTPPPTATTQPAAQTTTTPPATNGQAKPAAAVVEEKKVEAPKAVEPTKPAEVVEEKKEEAVAATPAPEPQPQVAPAPTPAPEVAPSAMPTLQVPPTPAPAPAVQPKQEAAEAMLIDTIDLSEPKGNWLKKRQWWQKAEQVYETIKQQVEQILDARMTFYNQQTDLNRNVIGSFYQQVGIGQGELEEIVSDLNRQVDELQTTSEKEVIEKDGKRVDEDQFMRLVKKEKDNLSELQKKISLVFEYDHSVEDAIIRLREQINIVRKYEQQAWNNFKAIARELSDQRAYELYYQMEGISNNIATIGQWMREPFANYFNQLINKIKNEIELIKTAVEELKKKGIDLKQESEKFDLLKGKCPREKIETEETVVEQETTFLGRIMGWISAPFTYLWSGITYVGSFIGSFFQGAYDGLRSLFVSAPEVEETEFEATTESE